MVQIWPNLDKFWVKKFFFPKSQIKVYECMKNHANGFFWNFFWLWQNHQNWDFANQSKINTKINWHDFSCIHTPLFDFLGRKFFWPKIWPILARFGPIFWAKFFILPPPNGIYQCELIPKVWHFSVCPFKSYSTWCVQTYLGQFLFDLAAFNVGKLWKVALTHGE